LAENYVRLTTGANSVPNAIGRESTDACGSNAQNQGTDVPRSLSESHSFGTLENVYIKTLETLQVMEVFAFVLI
jgi:hypothetical protein